MYVLVHIMKIDGEIQTGYLQLSLYSIFFILLLLSIFYLFVDFMVIHQHFFVH